MSKTYLKSRKLSDYEDLKKAVQISITFSNKNLNSLVIGHKFNKKIAI